MTNRRTFLKQTATLAALGTPWLTAEEPAYGAQPQEQPPAAAPDSASGRKSAAHTELADINAWEECPGYENAANRFNLTKEEAGFAIESETTQPAGPGVISYGVITTRRRHGAPGVKGTLVFEVDFVDYTNNGESGSPISSRRRGSTGIAITGSLRRIIS